MLRLAPQCFAFTSIYEHEATQKPISGNNIGRSAANEKTEILRYLPENTKTGDFNQQRTLSGSFFVIPERLASIRAVALAFPANKQTNKHSQLYIEIP